MRKGGRDPTKEQIVFMRGYDGHGEESGKIPTGKKKNFVLIGQYRVTARRN